jgi:hypothetical protein
VGAIDPESAGQSDGRVIVNEVDLVAGDDLRGTIELLVEGTLLDESDQIDCLYAIFTLDAGAVPTTGDGTYAGTIVGAGAFPDGACPTSGRPATTDDASGRISATISDDTMTGVVGEGPDDPNAFTFTATRTD